MFAFCSFIEIVLILEIFISPQRILYIVFLSYSCPSTSERQFLLQCAPNFSSSFLLLSLYSIPTSPIRFVHKVLDVGPSTIV